MDSMPQSFRAGLAGAATIDDQKVRGHKDVVVRTTVEQTLNTLLHAEADGGRGAGRYGRSPYRLDTRAGSYERGLEIKAGKVTLTVRPSRCLHFDDDGPAQRIAKLGGAAAGSAPAEPRGSRRATTTRWKERYVVERSLARLRSIQSAIVRHEPGRSSTPAS